VKSDVHISLAVVEFVLGLPNRQRYFRSLRPIAIEPRLRRMFFQVEILRAFPVALFDALSGPKGH
jgi:hypothetical protein